MLPPRRLGWGTPGIAWAANIVAAVDLAVVIALTAWWIAQAPEGRKPWAGFTWQALRQWGPYLKARAGQGKPEHFLATSNILSHILSQQLGMVLSGGEHP